MAQAFGPFVATVGSITPCPVTQPEVSAIRVVNTSRYDLAVSFAGHQPPAVNALGGGDWARIVPAGDRITFPIDLDLYPMGVFPGTVYVLPFDNSAGLALSGVMSSNNHFYMEALSAADATVSGFGSNQFVNLANQPRTIAVPIGLTHWAQGTGTLSGTLDVQSFLLTAAQKAAHIATVYFYFMSLCPETSVIGAMDFTVQLQFFSSGVAVGTPFTFIRAAVAASDTNHIISSYVLAPAFPLVFQFNGSVPATADEVRVQLAKINGYSLVVNYTVASNLDLTNLVPVADIGTAPLYNSSQASF